MYYPFGIALQFLKRIFIFTYLFMWFKLTFSSKRMKAIYTKPPLCFEVIPCNNADIFFTANNAKLFRLKSLK